MNEEWQKCKPGTLVLPMHALLFALVKTALVWRSDIVNRLMERLTAVAAGEASILLTGENCAGKAI